MLLCALVDKRATLLVKRYVFLLNRFAEDIKVGRVNEIGLRSSVIKYGIDVGGTKEVLFRSVSRKILQTILISLFSLKDTESSLALDREAVFFFIYHSLRFSFNKLVNKKQLRNTC